MKTITPTLLLEQIDMGAEVHPGESAFDIGIQVGRHLYNCSLEDFLPGQQKELERLYATGQIRFGHPGDFPVLPFFFRCQPKTQIKTP